MLDAKRWKTVLGYRDQIPELELKEGQLKNVTLVHGLTVLIAFGPQRPACSGCGAVLDLSATPLGADGVVHCPTLCGARCTPRRSERPGSWPFEIERASTIRNSSA